MVPGSGAGNARAEKKTLGGAGGKAASRAEVCTTVCSGSSGALANTRGYTGGKSPAPAPGNPSNFSTSSGVPPERGRNDSGFIPPAAAVPDAAASKTDLSTTGGEAPVTAAASVEAAAADIAFRTEVKTYPKMDVNEKLRKQV